MEYGLRRFEATQKLLWFVLFFGCLISAYLISTDPVPLILQSSQVGGSSSQTGLTPPGGAASAQGLLMERLKDFSFWLHLQGVYVEPEPVHPAKKDLKLDQSEPYGPRESNMGSTGTNVKPRILVRLIMYFIRVAILYLLVRFVWLGLQFVGKILLKEMLVSCARKPAAAIDSPSDMPVPGLGQGFPTRLLTAKLEKMPLKFIFHPFQRLRLILMDPRGVFSSEGLMEKERRIVDSDWQILWNSWSPFRWILWILPFLGLAQAMWLGYQHLVPLVSSVKDIQNGTMPDSRDIQKVLNSFIFILIPLVQIVVAAVFFSLVSGLLRRIEDLYLTNLDALLYDSFLSRLPFQSGDTVVLLQALQHYFQEMHASLKRIEKAMGRDVGPPEDVK